MMKDPRVNCDLCGKDVNRYKLKRHQVSCKSKAEKLANYKKSYDKLDSGIDFSRNVYHLIAATKEFKPEFTMKDFLSNFEVFNDIQATCCPHKEEKRKDHNAVNREHIHAIVYLKKDTQRYKNKLAKFFVKKGCYRLLTINKKEDTETLKKMFNHKRLHHTIFYIQTKDGRHPKTNHTNPLIFKNIYEKKKRISMINDRYAWRQFVYYTEAEKRFKDYLYREEAGFPYDEIKYLQAKTYLQYAEIKQFDTITEEEATREYNLLTMINT